MTMETVSSVVSVVRIIIDTAVATLKTASIVLVMGKRPQKPQLSLDTKMNNDRSTTTIDEIQWQFLRTLNTHVAQVTKVAPVIIHCNSYQHYDRHTAGARIWKATILHTPFCSE